MQKSLGLYLRLRPPFKTSIGEDKYLQTLGVNQIEILDKKQKISFQRVFDQSEQNSNAQEDFCGVIVPMLMSKLQNEQNATIISYGGAACGKTYSLYGDNHDGLLFKFIQKVFLSGKKHNISIKFLEIYNDKLFDLSSKNKNQIKQETQASSHTVQSLAELIQLFKKSQKNKQSWGTMMNNKSGCSVIQAIISFDKIEISFLDLPGHQIGLNCTETVRKEISSINSMLGNFQTVFEALNTNKKFVPWRNCLFTKLNKQRLQTNSISLIVHANPFDKKSVQTLSKVSRFTCIT